MFKGAFIYQANGVKVSVVSTNILFLSDNTLHSISIHF